MVQGYYTLSEAAQYLGISVDELKKMAQKSRLRSFQDRGTLRFRIQDIQELARQRGVSSDPDLVLGEASLPPKKGEGPRSPRTGPKTPPREEVPEVFDFEVDEGEQLVLDEGQPAPGSARKPTSGPKPKSGATPRGGGQPRSGTVPQVKAQPKSGSQPKSGAQPRSGVQPKSGSGATARGGEAGQAVPTPTPKPKPKSDSDVKLVPGAGDVTVSVSPDSDIKLRERTSDTAKAADSSGLALGKSGTGTGSGSKRPSQASPRSPQPADSGVRLVPMDSDSDVKIVGTGEEVPLGEHGGAQGDSNVRLEKVTPPPQHQEPGAMLTDEINLDEEVRKDEERKKAAGKKSTTIKPKSELKFPTTSPFELSDSDVGAPSEQLTVEQPAPAKDDSSDFEIAAAKDDSSNFELAPLKEDSSNFDLVSGSDATVPVPTGSDDDFSLELADDESVDLGGGGGELTAPASGINLGKPVDSGISLEDRVQSDDSLEFDLSLEPEATPKPAQMKDVEPAEGSSEFELSLEAAEAGAAAQEEEDSSEFELTLDESGQPAPEGAPQVKAGAEQTDQDIFESDFDIPAIQEEAAGESATVDTELESSDFDLALDDSELAADEESGSQVVALDEEEVEQVEGEVEAEPQVESEFADLEGEAEVEVEEEEDDRPARVEVHEKLIRPAPWGVMPALVMFPCVVIMLVVGLVGLEVVQSSVAHRPPGFVTRALHDNVIAAITGAPKLAP
jgi:excisionase family DNA binding protein